MLNKVIMMGRICKDIELRRTNSGTAVASFTIACDRDFTNKTTGEKETDFVEIVCWKNTAEFVHKYFGKGRMIVVSGRLQIRKWQDKEGKNRQTAEIVAEDVYFGDSKNGTTNTAAIASDPASDFAMLDGDNDSDLPF